MQGPDVTFGTPCSPQTERFDPTSLTFVAVLTNDAAHRPDEVRSPRASLGAGQRQNIPTSGKYLSLSGRFGVDQSGHEACT
jgi:hypothetical protein